MTPQPFEIQIPDSALADLHHRLDRTRWPDERDHSAANWDTGAPLAYMRSLTDYWRHQYDWRAEEAALNRFPQFHLELDGTRIHFLHVRGNGPSPTPLILTHGWPGSFAEMTRILPLLTDPAAHGGSPEDAFDVVVPSLPGYGFSARPTTPGMDPQRIAALWLRLMDALGYRRFGAQGGDWGSAISLATGLAAPDRVLGIHLNYIAGRFLLGGSLNEPAPDPLAATYQKQLKDWYELEGGYSHEQGTKPLTLSYGLNDSPVGLAAWIIEKFRTWSDCAGDVESIFTRDQLLTDVMLYWLTETIGSSARLYFETRLNPLRLSASQRIDPPVAVAVFPKEIPMPPRGLAERALNITRWTPMPRGGHFAAMEQPELLAGDLRAFFRTVR